MNPLVIYDSKGGVSRDVAYRISSFAMHVSDVGLLDGYDTIIFVCPTYGDEELSDDMECFLMRLVGFGKKYAVCETGNYYGYEHFGFGSRKILQSWLNGMCWEDLGGFSLDTYPPIDWNSFDKWLSDLHERS